MESLLTGTQCWINYFILLNLPVVTFASSYNTEVRVCLGIINITFDGVKRLKYRTETSQKTEQNLKHSTYAENKSQKY